MDLGSRDLRILNMAMADLHRAKAMPTNGRSEIDEVERAFEAAKQRAAVACAEAALAVDQLLMMYADELEHDKATSMILGPFPGECAKVEKTIWGLP